MSVGLVNGCTLAVVMGGATYLFFGPADHHGKLAITVGLALIINIFTGRRRPASWPRWPSTSMGRDPAVSSSDVRDLRDRLHGVLRRAADRRPVVALGARAPSR